MTALVVDASVAFRAFVDDPLSERCRDVFRRQDARRCAPELIVYEVVNAAWKTARAGLLTWEAAHEIAAEIAPRFDALVGARDLAPSAADLCRRLDHSAHDCFYLALAQREGADLVCADRRLADAATRIGLVCELIG
jgi:predicted nucleic acid-binding protein